MKYLKRISVIAAVVLIPILACTKESKNIQAQDRNTSIAMNNTNSEADNNAKSNIKVNVFNIKEVKKAVGKKVADFTFDMDGKTVSFSEYTKGKVVFLNFWGTWCPPCRAEIPDIIEISKELKDKDFVVIGIAVEKAAPDMAKNKVAEFAKKSGIDYTLIIGNSELYQAYGGIANIPATFIIDKDGTIAESISGMKDKSTFMKSINKFLK